MRFTVGVLSGESPETRKSGTLARKNRRSEECGGQVNVWTNACKLALKATTFVCFRRRCLGKKNKKHKTGQIIAHPPELRTATLDIETYDRSQIVTSSVPVVGDGLNISFNDVLEKAEVLLMIKCQGSTRCSQ